MNCLAIEREGRGPLGAMIDGKREEDRTYTLILTAGLCPLSIAKVTGEGPPIERKIVSIQR